MNEVSSSQMAMDLEDKYGAHNYHPLPVVLAKAEGVSCGMLGEAVL